MSSWSGSECVVIVHPKDVEWPCPSHRYLLLSDTTAGLIGGAVGSSPQQWNNYFKFLIAAVQYLVLTLIIISNVKHRLFNVSLPAAPHVKCSENAQLFSV